MTRSAVPAGPRSAAVGQPATAWRIAPRGVPIRGGVRPAEVLDGEDRPAEVVAHPRTERAGGRRPERQAGHHRHAAEAPEVPGEVRRRPVEVDEGPASPGVRHEDEVGSFTVHEVGECPRLGLAERLDTVGSARTVERVRREVPVQVDTVRVAPGVGRAAVGVEVLDHEQGHLRAEARCGERLRKPCGGDRPLGLVAVDAADPDHLARPGAQSEHADRSTPHRGPDHLPADRDRDDRGRRSGCAAAGGGPGCRGGRGRMTARRRAAAHQHPRSEDRRRCPLPPVARSRHQTPKESRPSPWRVMAAARSSATGAPRCTTWMCSGRPPVISHALARTRSAEMPSANRSAASGV